MSTLINTIEEAAAFWPVIKTQKIENVTPFIIQAQRDYIIPVLGQAQYDDLFNAYNDTGSGTLSAAQTALLAKVQASLSLFSYYLWIPSGQLQIGDNGIRRAETDTLKSAYHYQVTELQASILKQAGSAQDDLLNFLFDNKADYSLWLNSDAYTQFADFFVGTAKKFTEYFTPLGNSWITYMKLRSAMRETEDFTIQAELGIEFFAELKTQMKANTLTPPNQLVIPYIQKAVVNLAMNKGLIGMMATIDERGIVSFNSVGADINNPAALTSGNIVDALKKQTSEAGLAYIRLLKEFLKTNIADYPTYEGSSAYNSETTDTSFKNDSDNSFAFMG